MAETSTLNTQLHECLLTLQAETPGLLGAVLLTSGGLTIVSTLPASVEADVVAAMAAPMLALGERTVEELWQGRLSQVLIKGHEGPYALVEKVNSQIAMVALASREAKLGLVFMNVARTTLAIARIIGETLQTYPSVSRRPSAATIRRLRRLK